MGMIVAKLVAAGWKKSLEGWKDPIKGDKVTLAAAWHRYLKRLNLESS